MGAPWHLESVFVFWFIYITFFVYIKRALFLKYCLVVSRTSWIRLYKIYKNINVKTHSFWNPQFFGSPLEFGIRFPFLFLVYINIYYLFLVERTKIKYRKSESQFYGSSLEFGIRFLFLCLIYINIYFVIFSLKKK